MAKEKIKVPLWAVVLFYINFVLLIPYMIWVTIFNLILWGLEIVGEFLAKLSQLNYKPKWFQLYLKWVMDLHDGGKRVARMRKQMREDEAFEKLRVPEEELNG